jgi:division protein CdvB (Snf7/Vps24/ESCRT-III family)
MSFNKRWVKPTTNQGVTNKLLENKFMDNIKSPVPLKPKIEDAQKKLQLQISKLDGISNKMHEKDNLIFKRIVYAMQNHDSQYAKVLSNELSQIRKMDKMVCSAKLAMEQIQLRLNTITELGDVVVTLSPAMSVIGQISDLLSNIMNDSSQIPNTEISGTGMISEDSMKILEEASMVVEQSMKDKFPDLPSSSDIDEESSEASIY